MAKGDFYFPLYYKRLLTSTIGWKDDEFGAYLRLLIYQFDNGSIPNNIDELKRIAPSIKKHWSLISKKFHDDGNGGLINDVMDDVYQDVQFIKQRNIKNGKKGGRPKKPSGLILGNPDETQTKAIPITNSKYQITKEEEQEFRSIEECLKIALKDPRWVEANKTSEKELKEFNALLEKRGIYQKNPLDYKTHFANWKRAGKKDELPKQHSVTNHAREAKAKAIIDLKD